MAHRLINRDSMHSMGSILFLVCLTFVLVAARRAVPSIHASPDDPDSQFAMKAASGGMGEVKLGQLALDKGSNSAVRDFGTRMVTDHSKANQQLKTVAAQSNMTLPSDVSKAEQATYERLSKLSGADFDKAYAREMVRDHEEDVAEFQTESMSGKNDALRDFAARTLPTLQSHLQQAREMQKTVQ
jgi:putative membrane protein